MTASYAQTKRTTPSRHPERTVFEQEAIHAVLDEALVCHVAWADAGELHLIPNLHVRKGNNLYLHGSTGSTLMLAARQAPVRVAITVTLFDGLVLARSWFNHSINYRSVVVHGDASLVTDPDERWDAMVALMEHVATDRAKESRSANKRELAATAILRVPLNEVSLKHRSGPPKDDEDDLDLPHWAGVIPVATVFGTPEPDREMELPDYLRDYGRGQD